MNKNQILLEINAAIAAMLDSNWSYFSAPSYMKGFFCWRYNSVPLIRRLSVTPYTTCLFVTHICGLFCAHIYARLYPQSRKERKYTWQKNARISCSGNDCKYTWEKTARISCHNFETNGRPYEVTTLFTLFTNLLLSLLKWGSYYRYMDRSKLMVSFRSCIKSESRVDWAPLGV